MTDLDVSMDIESTGLNPWEDRVTTVALIGEHGDRIDVFDDAENEEDVLQQVEGYMRHTRINTLLGWNHTEFDLPFLAVRFVLTGVDMPPFIRPTGEVGKYGKLRYDGAWYGAAFHDIAYDYKEYAESVGVKWGLKPVAKAKKMGPGIEVDFEHQTILDLTKEQRELYCVSDAQLVLGLAEQLPLAPKGQAVTLNEGFSIL